MFIGRSDHSRLSLSCSLTFKAKDTLINCFICSCLSMPLQVICETRRMCVHRLDRSRLSNSFLGVCSFDCVLLFVKFVNSFTPVEHFCRLTYFRFQLKLLFVYIPTSLMVACVSRLSPWPLEIISNWLSTILIVIFNIYFFLYLLCFNILLLFLSFSTSYLTRIY